MYLLRSSANRGVVTDTCCVSSCLRARLAAQVDQLSHLKAGGSARTGHAQDGEIAIRPCRWPTRDGGEIVRPG